jgi:hypothetical protein
VEARADVVGARGRLWTGLSLSVFVYWTSTSSELGEIKPG